MKKFKRYVASTLAIILIACAILPDFALGVSADTKTDVQRSVENRISKVADYVFEYHTGEYGLLYDLRQIMEMGMYLDHLTKCDKFSVTESQLEYYTERYNDAVSTFNNRYEYDSTVETKLILDTGHDFTTDFRNNMYKIIPTYLDTRLKSINDAYAVIDNDTSKEDYLDDNRILIMNFYKVISTYQTIPEDLTNLTPADKNGNIAAYSVMGDDNNKKIKDVINKIIKNYTELLSYGKEAATVANIVGDITINEDADPVTILTNAQVNESGEILAQDSYSLSAAYLAILAASSVYTPLTSYAGDTEFTSALKSLISNQTEAGKLVNVYNNTKDFRKPLYKRSLDTNGDPTGTASLITIEDFFNEIESGDAGSLVAVTGDFSYNGEVDSWVYYQDSGAVVGDSESDNNNAELTGSGNNTVNETETGSEEVAAKYDEVSIPDGSTRTEKIGAWMTRIVQATYDYGLASESNKSNAVEQIRNSVSELKKVVKIKGSGNVSDSLIKDQKVIDIMARAAKCRVPSVSNNAIDSQKKLIDAFRNYYELYKAASDVMNADGLSQEVKDMAKKLVDNYTNYCDQCLLGLANINNNSSFKKLSSGNSNPFNSNGKYAAWIKWINSATGNLVKTYKSDQSDKLDDYKKTLKNKAENKGLSVSNVKDVTSQYYTGDYSHYVLLSISANTSDNDSDSKLASIKGLLKSLVGPVDAHATATDGNNTTTAADSEETAEVTTSADSDETTTSAESETDSASATTVSDISTTTQLEATTQSRDLNKAIFAYDEMTDETKFTQPVLFYGTRYNRAVDNATTMLLNNIIKNAANLNAIKNKSTRYLYVNVYGDIVTDDNLVILPGIANPLLYNGDSAYNPYTVAFVNNYPNILAKSSSLKFVSENDIGKYILMSAEKESNINNKEIRGYLVNTSDTVKETSSIAFPLMEGNFYSNSSDSVEIYTANRYVIGDLTEWQSKDIYEWSPIAITKTPTVSGNVVFPYVVTEDPTYSVAKVIATNMFIYLALDRQTNIYTNAGKLADNYIANNLVFNGLNGTNNPLGYAKNRLLEYEQFVNNSLERFKTQISDISRNILDNIKDVDGVIGLKSSYVDPILGNIFQVVRDLFVPFMLICGLLILIAFMKMKRDLIESAILTGVSLVVVFLFIYIFPIYLPMAYNVVINNVCEVLTYEVLGVKTEINDTNDTNVTMLDDTGNFVYDTSSLTLYRVGFNEINKLADDLGVTSNEISGGNRYIIDQEAGLFAEGDSIKINTDILFKTLPITGSYTSEGSDDDTSGVYQLKATKTVSNNVDYYTPYYQMVDIFIERLNAIGRIYNIPRKTTTYANNKVKDNYLVYSFVNSEVFLMPGEYGTSEIVETTMTDDEREEYETKNANIQAQLKEVFGDTNDFLGLSSLLFELTPEMQNTLWAKTMQTNGYYDAEWDPDVDRISTVINYVNTNTKKFIFDIEDQIGKLSDETMIKIITLRALVALTQETSEYGHWWYPFSINYDEMILGDIVQCVYTNDYSKYINMDMDVISYISEELGLFHLLIFDANLILMFVIVNLIKIIVPILYLLLGFMLIAKMYMSDDLRLPVKGFLKCNALMITVFTLFGVFIVVASNMNGSAFSIYITLLINLVTLFVLVTVATSVLTNITDLGNSTVNVNIAGGLGKIPALGTKIANLQVNNLSHNKLSETEQNEYTDRFSKYDYDASVDDRYDNNYAVYDDMSTGYNAYNEDYTDNLFVTDTDDSVVSDLTQYE